MTKPKILLFLALSLLAVLTLSACGDNTATPSSVPAAPVTSSTTAARVTPASAATTIAATITAPATTVAAITTAAPAASTAATTAPMTTAPIATTAPNTTSPTSTDMAGMAGMTTAANRSTTAVTGATTLATDAKVVMANIKNFAFMPTSITVTTGTKVIWTNQDSAEHTVTGDNNPLKSDLLTQGKTYEYTFDKPGTYSYYCAVHPFMKGTVTVS